MRKGTSKEATLFVRIRKRVHKIDKNVNTRIVIDRNVWERANKDAASLEKFYRTKDGQTIYRKMCAIDQALEELLCQGKFDNENIDHAVESIVFAEIREQQRKEEEERKQKKQAAEEARKKMCKLSSMTSLQESERGLSNIMAIPIVSTLVKSGSFLGLFLNASTKSTHSLGRASTSDWWISFYL